jgi:hypothetical protein
MNEKAIESMIAKVQLSAKIAQIALACPSCQGPVNKEIQVFKNRNVSHQGGGRSSFAAMNETDGLDNDYSTLEYK